MPSKITDKELYNHFKTRSHTLDESPDDALWNSIAVKIYNKPSGKRKRQELLSIVAIAIIGILAFIFLLPNQDKAIQQQQVPPQISFSDTLTVTDTLSSYRELKKVEEITSEKPNQISNTLPNINNSSTLKPHSKTLNQNNYTANKTKLDTVKPNISKIKLITKKYNGRILIKVKETITQVQFDSLVDASFNNYKTEYNTILLIQAPNLKPYRTRITKFSKPSSTDKLEDLEPTFLEFRPKKIKISDSLIILDTLIETKEILLKTKEIKIRTDTISEFAY